MIRFEIITYDVWGNETDGYDVNAAYSTSDFVPLHEDMDDTDIIDQLVEIGFLDATIQSYRYDIEGDFEYSLYIGLEGYPIAELRNVQEI